MIIVNYEPVDRKRISSLRRKNHELYYFSKQDINAKTEDGVDE